MIRFLSFSLLKEIEGTRAITSLAFLMPLYSSPQKLTTGAEPALCVLLETVAGKTVPVEKISSS